MYLSICGTIGSDRAAKTLSDLMSKIIAWSTRSMNEIQQITCVNIPTLAVKIVNAKKNLLDYAFRN